MSRKALFLDRDGIINVEKNYVHRIEDFEFMDGIFDLLSTAQEQGYLLVVITNQAGIARGYYTEEDFQELNNWMLQAFAEKGITIQKVYFCPFHPVHGKGKYKVDSEFRKPGPGMILQAQKELEIDLSHSLLLGDKESDIEAGIKAGIGQNVLLKSDRYNGEGSKASLMVNHLKEVKPLLKAS
ncbi:D-glycero-alpha-D-manno-heptose-1,7-bisphosphate 7-phosphatase [Nafulsella turpanensis]|uniref:D-glycero-alpha-D-manno-heptose-1,7-bisphosphate 7-phosphatase n=1 Tax=Nafulsella turpanensis TaxID=1265690 RepID=UPI00034509FC|nr:HAD family hydrolase [Nafulsella turpanensis]